jgi:hypothetical protein
LSNFTESIVEDASLAWLEALGYSVLHGPEIAAGMTAVEQQVNAVMQSIRNNIKQSQTLFGLRDSLLPKLISGELRVNDGKLQLKGAAT